MSMLMSNKMNRCFAQRAAIGDMCPIIDTGEAEAMSACIQSGDVAHRVHADATGIV